eukprot:7388122-Prymnesium_polylepis.2
MDGEAGIAAGREAALAVLGRGTGTKDGFDMAEDMEEEAIGEDGSRGRRKALPNGRLVGCEEFRAQKTATSRSAAEAEVAEREAGYKKTRLNERVLSESEEAEKKLEAGAFVSQALLVSYVRARTDKPVAEKGDVLKQRADQLKKKSYAIRLGEEPDGYQAWLAEEAAKAAAKAAAKTAAATAGDGSEDAPATALI